MELKQKIIQKARSLGFHNTVIAGLQPLSEDGLRYQQWLEQGYAADMEYLKRNYQLRSMPQHVQPQALSAIVVAVSYYSAVPEPPAEHFGRVANYAVGLDYHVVLKAKLRELRSAIEEIAGRKLIGKPYTDDVALYEQALARRHGIGFRGKNSLIIGPRLMGSYNFIAELFTDLPLEADEEYRGTCGQCFRCAAACPTDAIVQERTIDARLCISYLTIENKGAIPVELRPKIGRWVFGCDACQQVCPYNQHPATTLWPEFQPAAGVGHYVDLLDLLRIKTDEEFRQRFLPTALRRPKRRGLLRNALVVLGNMRPEYGIGPIIEFAQNEPDEMLREHAAWALSRFDESRAQRGLSELIQRESDDLTKRKMQAFVH